MAMPDKTPKVWDCGDAVDDLMVDFMPENFRQKLEALLNETIYAALKEYITDDAPWMLAFPYVEYYVGDPAEISSKRITVEKLILDYVASQCNEYWGTGDEANLEEVYDYLVRLATKISLILHKVKKGNSKKERLSSDDMAQFELLFEVAKEKPE